jgi:hypothetical protein
VLLYRYPLKIQRAEVKTSRGRELDVLGLVTVAG